MVPTGDISSTLDNLAMAATADQSHMNHMMEAIRHLMETNNILGYQIKQLTKTNAVWSRQGQEDKKASKK